MSKAANDNSNRQKSQNSKDTSISENQISNEKNEVSEKARWLSETIEEGLELADKKKEKFKRKASIIKLSTLLLSGFATILLGVQIQGWEDKFKMVAFIFGALVTILNAVEPYFNFRSLWIEHEEVVYRLYRLKDDLSFYLKGKQTNEISIDELEKFNITYAKIWHDVSQKWLALRKSEGIKSSEKNG